MIQKITYFNPTIKNQIAKSSKKAVATIVPLVAVPMLSYMSTQKDELKGNLLEETFKTNKTVTENLEKSKEILENHGVKLNENNVTKYVKSNGELKDSVERKINKADKNAKKISSRGKEPSEGVFDSQEKQGVALQEADLDNVNIEDVDVSMTPELENYLETPLEETPDGLIDSIADLLSDGVEWCKGFFSSVKEFLVDLVDGV